MSLETLANARDRLRAFIDEVERTGELEFPYAHSSEAIKRIKSDFDEKLKYVELLLKSYDSGSAATQCALSLKKIFDCLPMLGLLRRSTNPRNPFEVFGPLLRLAGDVLEPKVPKAERKTRLILSSEWRYSPFIRHNDPILPGFVVIGLPACESANPLILPLSGHEFGHSLWNEHKLKQYFTGDLQVCIADAIKSRWDDYLKLFPAVKPLKQTDILKLKAKRTWLPAFEWSAKQAEESFCDFVGLKIFGRSYLKAFAYLLSPKLSGMGSQWYPNMAARVANLVTAAKSFGVSAPEHYQSMFEADTSPPLGPADEFRLALADDALEGLVPALINKAGDLIEDTGINLPTDQGAAAIFDRFKLGIPAVGVKCISDILNAGWRAYEDSDFWKGDLQLAEDTNRRKKNLSELILKSFEVFEIEQIIESPSNA